MRVHQPIADRSRHAVRRVEYTRPHARGWHAPVIPERMFISRPLLSRNINLHTRRRPESTTKYSQANSAIYEPAGQHVPMRVESQLQSLLRKLNGLHGLRFLLVGVHRGCSGLLLLLPDVVSVRRGEIICQIYEKGLHSIYDKRQAVVAG